MKKRNVFLKIMLFVATLTLGIGYATVSEKIFDLNANITVGTRTVNTEIVSGGMYTEMMAPTQGQVNNDDLSISFAQSWTANQAADIDYIFFAINFENNEEFNVKYEVAEVVVKLDGEEFEDFNVTDTGFQLSNGQGGLYYGKELNANDSGSYEVTITWDSEVMNLEFYGELSISIKFKTTVSK